MLKNWKTTLAGAAAIATALGDIFNHIVSGDVGSGALEKDVMTIIVGLGLIFAKDHNVSGDGVQK